MRVLKLDQSYKPVEIVPWTEAMRLIYLDKAEIVEAYPDQLIRSVNSSYPAPCIIRILQGIEKPKRLRFSRENVYRRDEYTCQYCNTEFSVEDLTLDHVQPASRGGRKSWENIVTACTWCNGKKADKTLEQFGARLMKRPGKPKESMKMILRISDHDPKIWLDYVKY